MSVEQKRNACSKRMYGSFVCMLSLGGVDMTERLPRPTPQAIAEWTDKGEELGGIFGLGAGIFGFSMTLLASTTVIPDVQAATSGEALALASGKLISGVLNYIQIFVMTAILWISFHRSFKFIKRYDSGLHWLVIFMALQVALIPFLAQVADIFDGPEATAIFFLAFFVIGLFDNWIWRYATNRHRLVDPALDPRLIQLIGLQSLVPDLFFLLCAGISWLTSDALAGMVFTFGLILVAIFGKAYRSLLIGLVWRG